ncbi:MAG TPA: hypothetical protein PLZ45_03115 [Ferruginibacter sp.]|nr:hypothetical protein [Ferruginibacter sp.]
MLMNKANLVKLNDEELDEIARAVGAAVASHKGAMPDIPKEEIERILAGK